MMKMQVKKLYRYEEEEEEDGGKRSSKQWCMVAKGRSNEPFRLKLKQAKEERSVRKGGEEGKAARGSDK